MSFYQNLISGSRPHSDKQIQTRIEILRGAILARGGLIVSIIAILFYNDKQSPYHLFLVLAFNFVCYFVSRTKYFNFAAWAIILDPIFFFSIQIVFVKSMFQGSPQSILILMMGPVIASLVLSFRATAVVIFLTALIVLAMFFKIDPILYRLHAELATFIMATSLLSLTGTFLRERSDHDLEIERGKLVHANKLAALGEMASGMGHELNSPLAAIVLNSELIDEMISHPHFERKEISSHLSDIRATAEQMSGIISNLKTIGSETSNLNCEWIAPRDWIEDVLLICRQRFEANRIQLNLCGDDINTPFNVGRTQASQVLLSLLDNSFDSVRSLEKRSVSIHVSAETECVKIRVTDSGRGVDTAFKKKLFSPFATTKDFGKGTGLSLSVSRAIMRGLGGDLIYDEEAVNTTFIMIFKMKNNIREYPNRKVSA